MILFTTCSHVDLDLNFPTIFPMTLLNSCDDVVKDLKDLHGVDKTQWSLSLALEPCGAVVAVKKLGYELRSTLPIFNSFEIRLHSGYSVKARRIFD